ncbi:MAG: DUF72 domain-containing protein [Chryseolinea sp.]
MSDDIFTNYHSGLSGINLPIPKYNFPPEFQNSSRLTYYATIFNSIEVNSSFYAIPQKKTLERWAGSVGRDFEFTFKVFKEVTHVKELNFDAIKLLQFMTVLNAQLNKGCLLLQFPPGLTSNNLSQLEVILQIIERENIDHAWRIAVEFRNKGWYNEEVYALLEFYGASLVKHDIPASATPSIDRWSDLLYLRFHGPTGNYRGSYTDDFLYEQATSVRNWLIEGKTAYVYFNNTAGDAFNNLATFNNTILDSRPINL